MQRIFDPYHANHYRNRKVGSCFRISATDTLFGFIKEVKESLVLLPIGVSFEKFRIRTKEEADWVLNQLNTAQTRYCSIRNIQSDRQNWQRWSAIQSNLGKGFLFYFVCNSCQQSVRHLYKPDGQFIFLCRDCHGVRYSKSSNKRLSQNGMTAGIENSVGYDHS